MAFPSTSWVEDAACVGVPTEMFFPEPGKKGDALAAKRVCMGCPVMKQCGEYADKFGIEYGIWGAESRQEVARSRIPDKHLLVSCAECGRTMKPGYMVRHQRYSKHTGITKP